MFSYNFIHDNGSYKLLIRQVISMSNFSIVCKLKPLVIFLSSQFSLPLRLQYTYPVKFINGQFYDLRPHENDT